MLDILVIKGKLFLNNYFYFHILDTTVICRISKIIKDKENITEQTEGNECRVLLEVDITKKLTIEKYKYLLDNKEEVFKDLVIGII